MPLAFPFHRAIQPATRRAAPRALLAATLVVAMSPLAAQQSPVPDSLATRQVEIGEQWFRAVCFECHASNLGDADFRAKWSGRSAYDLFDRMRNSMPDSDPGSLTPETYLAVVAYLMKLNGLPVASTALIADSTALSAVKLTFPSTSR